MQLNVEQQRIIDSKPNGHALIKGVAGSGKTTVAVNRVPILLSNYCAAKDDFVLVSTFNKSLVKYVSYVYEGAQEERNNQENFFTEDNSGKLEIKNIDALMFYYFSMYKADNKQKVALATQTDTHNALIDAISDVSSRYPDVKIIDYRNFAFLKEEINWIKSCNYLDLYEYQTVDRLGRVSKANQDGPQKIRKNSEQRNAIFEVLNIYNNNLKKVGKIDFNDMNILALEQAKKAPKKKYTHILIDECQDLSRVQLEFLKALYNEKEYSSITFITDVAQSIYPQAWLVKNRSFTSLGYDMTGKSNSLSKNYRTTTQIAQAAYSLIKKDQELIEDDNFVKPNLIDKQGDYPIYRSFRSKDDEGNYISKLISFNLKKNYELKDIVIIARRKGQLEEIKKYLIKANIPVSLFDKQDEFDFGEESVKLVTMHSIKGLEFKVVIMAGVNAKVMPYVQPGGSIEDSDVLESRERKLLYVGMTRATEKLIITSEGTPSRFIKDIDYEYLRVKENCAIRRISQIDIENYILTDSIKDIYSAEEKVRQWMLRELTESYKYPLNLISLEERINIGSRVCAVDIGVDIFRNKVKGPYILVEVKRWGAGTDIALSQLKSYMANCPSAQYGIATDGNEVVIINKDLEEIDDIPKFDSSMLPSTLKNIEYINLKWNTSHKFIKDTTTMSDIYIEKNGIETKVEEIRPIPVYNEIAAGIPMHINDSIQGSFYLPVEWVGLSNDIFMLKIKGDSMKNKNINDGDYVIINKQTSANIGEIVAVDIEGNSTLKTYKTIGGKILLMPENDEYEPIMMEEDQLSIIGVAVGLVKGV